jgi:hypothetical protein
MYPNTFKCVWVHLYLLYVSSTYSINFVSSYDFSARFWNCFDSVVFFAFHFIKILYYDYCSFNKIVSKVTFDDIYLQNPT